jgi:hypothetical protein
MSLATKQNELTTPVSIARQRAMTVMAPQAKVCELIK